MHTHKCSVCSAIIATHGVEMDWGRREIRCGATVIILTPSESDLLAYLFRNMNHWTTLERLTEALYGGSSEGNSRTVSVLLVKIRRKLTAKPIGVRLPAGKSRPGSLGQKLEFYDVDAPIAIAFGTKEPGSESLAVTDNAPAAGMAA
jgi:Transcriptional regulatory protein, C terminal